MRLRPYSASRLTQGLAHAPPLAEQIQDRFAGAERPGDAVLGHARFKRHAQGVVDRGAEVLRPHRPVLHVGADLVGLAVDRAAANAAAGQDRGTAMRPVLPAGMRPVG